MKFNINEYVGVKLNERGRGLYFRWLDAISTPETVRLKVHCLPQVDDDGYSMIQMWEFMHIYGPYLNHVDNPPFDTTIKFDQKDFTD